MLFQIRSAIRYGVGAPTMPKIDITVRELVEMIDRGELRLPEMQRRYVWPATRVRDLLDSLYRGYPSGAILVWETTKDILLVTSRSSKGSAPLVATNSCWTASSA